jgi:hypothetical protein
VDQHVETFEVTVDDLLTVKVSYTGRNLHREPKVLRPVDRSPPITLKQAVKITAHNVLQDDPDIGIEATRTKDLHNTWVAEGEMCAEFLLELHLRRLIRGADAGENLHAHRIAVQLSTDHSPKGAAADALLLPLLIKLRRDGRLGNPHIG